MPYIPNSDEDRKEMMDALGISSIDELFSNIPAEHLITDDWKEYKGKSEQTIVKEIRETAGKNKVDNISFLGGGAYDHYIPAMINHVILRSEFYTAYTPYQPEVSQGTLQAIFEYQTMICELTGMHVSNASLYDGASAIAEAALLATGHTKKKKLIIASSLPSNYKALLSTYSKGGKYETVEVPCDDGLIDREKLNDLLKEDAAGLVVQYPNYFGNIEDLTGLAEIVHSAGGLLIAAVNPIALAMLKSPGECGVDIVTGEGQVLGNELNWGGPYLGIFAAKKELIRKMPGRIIGKTVDVDGKQGFVLSLQTREQHIRREKATSNICTNQGLIALKAVVYMTLMGKEGIREVANQCLQKAHYLAEQISAVPGFKMKFDKPFFHEFAVSCPKPAKDICERLLEDDIYAGIPLDDIGDPNALLIAVTEQRTKDEMDYFVEKLKAI
ncbi:MAG: aminomethyl-transferring glycine dehydrogenase subunit GcvPA [bacterium]|nr:aminomethyl-transferring glycine dehydrogenase subunit GcvPA [bacterium]